MILRHKQTARLSRQEPVAIYTEGTRVSEIIQRNFWPTMEAASIGFVLALGLAFVIAIPLAANDRLYRGFMPIIVGSNTVPRIALAPLILFYIGEGTRGLYLIAAWVAFFPMLINILEGMKDINEDERHMLTVFGASTWQEFKYVRIKNSLPFMFDGMKTGVLLAMIGAIVGEFIAHGGSGLGSLAFDAMNLRAMDRVFAVVMVAGAVTTAAVFTLYLLQQRLVFWQDATMFGGET